MLGALEFSNTFRGILWAFARFFLGIADYCYDILKVMMSIRMDNLMWFWNIYILLILLTGMFIAVRFLFLWLKSIYDDRVFEKIKGANVFVRIGMIAFILSANPVFMPLAFNAMSDLTKKFPELITNENVKMSQVILDASISGFKLFNAKGQLISNQDITKQKQTIINQAKEGGEDMPSDIEKVDTSTKNVVGLNMYDVIQDKINARKFHNAESYYFFQDLNGILIALVMGGICSVLMIYISFQVASRFISLLFKILLAPYAVSGLIDPEDNGTSTWFRLCVADLVGNFFQMLFLWLSLLATLWFDKAGLIKAIFFLACLIGILSAPQGVAQLLGSDIGASAGMQGMRQGMQFLSTGIGGFKLGTHALKQALHIAGGTTRTTSQLAMYTAARMLGMESLNPSQPMMDRTQPSIFNGGKSDLHSGSDGSIRQNSPFKMKEGSPADRISNFYKDSRFGQSRLGGMAGDFAKHHIKKGGELIHRYKK